MESIGSSTILGTFATAARGDKPLGRIVLLDRGEKFKERYMVAWQEADGDHAWKPWLHQPTYLETFFGARDAFVADVKWETGEDAQP